MTTLPHGPLAHGSWPSPISAERIGAGASPLSTPMIDGDDVYWLQGQATEGGRLALMRAGASGAPEVLTPAPLNLRSRVHEYGGGACAVRDGVAIFCNAADQRVFRLDVARDAEAKAEAVPITLASPQRYADFQFDPLRARVYAVQEDHSTAGAEPRNTLVALALDGAAEPLPLHSGFDFYAAPRPSPDGRQLAWLCWRHPDMPWCGTELWCADVLEYGGLSRARRLAGGRGEALCQPRWSPEGRLYVVSDRSEWWNLYRVDVEAGVHAVDGDAANADAAVDRLHAVCPQCAECGQPMWVFGQSLWDVCGPHHVLMASIADGISRLWHIDLRTGQADAVELPFTELHELHCGDDFMVCLAASATEPQQLIRIDGAGGADRLAATSSATFRVLARSLQHTPEARWLSSPQPISYPSGDATAPRQAHAFYYPPTNPECHAPAGAKPPLLVVSHGGPTAMSTASLVLSRQYWTSRGFALLDVNYGGSTGYGRPYRQLLDGQWGIVDVQDCVAGARHLAALGWVDADRMAIRGGSASGFTTLSALIFHDIFKAGTSLYGVADLAALDADTHKFESRYTEQLICAPVDRARVYAERSPIAHVQRLNCPMLFLQGLDDRVVPPAQSRVMVEALRSRGVPVAYIEFEGEGHGFRQAATQRRALEAELAFYGRVFGFTPAGGVIELDMR